MSFLLFEPRVTAALRRGVDVVRGVRLQNGPFPTLSLEVDLRGSTPGGKAIKLGGPS